MPCWWVVASLWCMAVASTRYGGWSRGLAGSSTPEFRYTLNQLADDPVQGNFTAENPFATDPTARSKREHNFVLGNRRVTLIASNYGQYRLRQDEGGPKFLNDAELDNASAIQYGGGFGYLQTASEPLTSFYLGQEQIDRVFGAGYSIVNLSTPSFGIVHGLAVPYGDDPVVLIEVNISNFSPNTQTVRWNEVWGSKLLNQDFFFRDCMPSLCDRRQFSSRHYSSTFSQYNPQTVLHQRSFRGLTPEEQAFVAANISQIWIKTPFAANSSLWDESPPSVFLSSVGQASSFGTDASKFFASGGVKKPAFVLDFRSQPTEDVSAIISDTPLQLSPFESKTLHFVYGYLPADLGKESAQLDALLSKYTAFCSSGNVLFRVAQEWDRHLHHFDVPSLPWLGPEMAWHSHSLQASMSFDSFYEESILDQGTQYRYSIGEQAAARDPLQHVLPLAELDPASFRSVLRYTLKEQQKDVYDVDPDNPVLLPYAMVGKGVVMAYAQPDDMELYLLQAAARYVLSTKDTLFLNETVSVYNCSTCRRSVLTALIVALNFTLEVVGTGPHGLVRLLSSDWDDGLGPPPEAFNVSESVLTSTLALSVLPSFAEMLRLVGDTTNALRCEAAVVALSSSLWKYAWNGRWLARAWMGPRDGWLGETQLYSAQQGFALLGGLFEGQQGNAEILVAQLQQHCGGDYGFNYHCFESQSGDSGSWAALLHPLLLGLVRANFTDLAWDQFVRSSLQWRSQVLPSLWVGQWTAGDHVQPELWPSNYSDAFPGLCLHPHAWPLVSLPGLMGLAFDLEGLALSPRFPRSLGNFSTSTPLLAMNYTVLGKGGRFVGVYRPLMAGVWRVRVTAPPGGRSRVAVWAAHSTDVRSGETFARCPTVTRELHFSVTFDY